MHTTQHNTTKHTPPALTPTTPGPEGPQTGPQQSRPGKKRTNNPPDHRTRHHERPAPWPGEHTTPDIAEWEPSPNDPAIRVYEKEYDEAKIDRDAIKSLVGAAVEWTFNGQRSTGEVSKCTCAAVSKLGCSLSIVSTPPMARVGAVFRIFRDRHKLW